MTKFIDGPAAGVVLELSRAPVLLRAVYDAASDKWDALDMSNDEPRPGEVVHVYVIASKPVTMYIFRRGPGQRSGWRTMAEYRLLPWQPSDVEARTMFGWARWTIENKDRVLALPNVAKFAGASK